MNRLPAVLVGHAVLAAVLLGLCAAFGWPPARLAETAWWWPMWIAQAGLLAGSLAWVGLSERPDDAAETIEQGRRTDLAETRALVVEQLRHLDVERDKLDPEDYAAERAALLQVGAAASRALEEGEAPAPEPVAAEPSPDDLVTALVERLKPLREADPATFDRALARLGARPEPEGLPDLWKGVVWTLMTVGVIAFIAGNVGGEARDRVGGMPMTGGDQVMEGNARTAQAAGPEAPPPDPVLQQLQQQVQEHPDDLTAWNQLTELSLARQRMSEAMAANESALKLDPQDRDARVFQAVLQAFIGRVDAALDALDGILEEDPVQLRALVYRGLLSIDRDPATAVTVLERAAALDDNPMLRRALADARQRLDGGDPGPASAGPERLVAGTLSFDGEIPPGTTLFLSLRDPSGGPPIAARKIPAATLPETFELTTADRLPMGGERPLPSQLLLTARLDTDGDPLTRPPSDPSATATVEAGSEGVALVLKAGS